jgi:hypothetical protein
VVTVVSTVTKILSGGHTLNESTKRTTETIDNSDVACSRSQKLVQRLRIFRYASDLHRGLGFAYNKFLKFN